MFTKSFVYAKWFLIFFCFANIVMWVCFLNTAKKMAEEKIDRHNLKHYNQVKVYKTSLKNN